MKQISTRTPYFIFHSGCAFGLAFLLTSASLLRADDAPAPGDNPEYPNFYTGKNSVGDKNIDWVKSIAVSDPAYGSDIKGNVTVKFSAPGMTKVKALCWQQPSRQANDKWGHDQEIAPDIKLDESGNGSFLFPADKYPNGPITIRIYAKDDAKKQDICELQVYNQGGVVWNQGIPKSDPAAAKGMKLAFADDFDGALSISGDGNNAKYQAHKTGGGDFSGWPFSNPDGELNPFSQKGSYLRIHASKKEDGKTSSGIISSAHEDGGGFYASAPCYLECRFIAQSAPGTWPAFWTLTKNCLDKNKPQDAGCDEHDIIEAYGGQGQGNPNFPGYAVTSHYWNQKDANGVQIKDDHTDVPIMTLGGNSTWSTTFHTYGMLVTKTESVYYFDDIEVLRFKTKPLSQVQPFWFLVNYAIGGISGWKIDLDRYNNSSDMWVDYVRVYQGKDDSKPTP